MKTTKQYLMNGKTYSTMTAIAADLGVKRIYAKDFAKYSITEINQDDVKSVKAEPAKVAKAEPAKVAKAEDKVEDLLPRVPNLTIDEFSKIVGKLSLIKLVELGTKAKVNLWETIKNEPIRKMRLVMELKARYYPNQKVTPQPVSKWQSMTLDDLKKLAKTRKIAFDSSTDYRIQRMKIIMGLKKLEAEVK